MGMSAEVGNPLPFSLKTVPVCVPGGTVTSAVPSRVGTSTCAPSEAFVNEMGPRPRGCSRLCQRLDGSLCGRLCTSRRGTTVMARLTSASDSEPHALLSAFRNRDFYRARSLEHSGASACQAFLEDLLARAATGGAVGDRDKTGITRFCPL